MYCRECGADMGKLRICPECSCDNRGKSRLVAGLLQLLCGSVGFGRFYLGYKGIGFLQLGASLVTCGLGGAVWGFVDGIFILNGTPQRDAHGFELVD